MALGGIGHRFRIALRAAVGIFSDQSLQAAHGMLAGILPGGLGAPPVRGTREYLQAYSQMPWLRAVTGRIADSVAAVDWKLYVATAPRNGGKAVRDRALQRARWAERAAHLRNRLESGDAREIVDHPLLDMLDTANSFQTGHAMRKVTQTHLDLVGEAFWLKERNGLGAPISVWPIPPSWILSTPTPSRRTYRVSYRAWQGEIPDTEFLWFSDPDPENPYGRGSGIARALADELETDEYAAKTTRQWFFNRARPDLIITPKGEHATLNDPERIRLEQDWLNRNQGFWRAFKPYFLNKEVTIHELDQDFRSQQFVQLRAHERDIIVHVFGMPPEILGILENSNRATIEAADYLFARWLVVPRLEFLRTVMQERLIPEFDERLILDYTSPVQEDKTYKLEVARSAPWTLTVDEWRAQQGLPPLEDGRGAVHLVPFNLAPSRFGGEMPATDELGLAGLTTAELLKLYQRDGSP